MTIPSRCSFSELPFQKDRPLAVCAGGLKTEIAGVEGCDLVEFMTLHSRAISPDNATKSLMTGPGIHLLGNSCGRSVA